MKGQNASQNGKTRVETAKRESKRLLHFFTGPNLIKYGMQHFFMILRSYYRVVFVQGAQVLFKILSLGAPPRDTPGPWVLKICSFMDRRIMKQSQKRYMVSGSPCPLISFLGVYFSVSFVVRGQWPHRG